MTTFQSDTGAGAAKAGPASPGADAGEPLLQVLAEDLAALASDALNYADAELAFQKTRARFVGNRLITAIALGIVAAVLVLLALIGLTVGLLIALIPLVSAWGATAIVFLVLLLAAWLCVRAAAGAASAIKGAFAAPSPPVSAEEALHG